MFTEKQLAVLVKDVNASMNIPLLTESMEGALCCALGQTWSCIRSCSGSARPA